jgi:hypothetical protein
LLNSVSNSLAINLAGGTDTLILGATGAQTLNISNIENVQAGSGNDVITLQNAANGLTIDLAGGADSLTLSGSGDNTLTVKNVENLTTSGNTNDTVTLFASAGASGLTVNLGAGTANALNLAGTVDHVSINVSGNALTVGDQTDSGNLNLTLITQTNGVTFDFGAGTGDTLTLFAAGSFSNSATVSNIENVNGSSNSDVITIGGNSNVTTVTGGLGTDFITASAGDDHFRFTGLSDSAAGPGRDQVTGFDADHDQFVFDGIAGMSSSQQVHFIAGPNFSNSGDPEAMLANIGGLDVVQVDTNGDGTADLEVQVNGLTGTLHDTNFFVV